MAPALSRFATLRRTLAVCAIGCVLAQGASAQSAKPWTERPYNPPVGSKWSIVSDSFSEETLAKGEKRTRKLGMISELTIEERLADGFRVSYVNRDLQVTGNAPGIEIAAAAFGAMKDIVVRGRTDASGKPLAIDNLPEVKTSMRVVVDRMSVAFQKNPKVAALIKQIMEGLLMVDGPLAATTYMEDLPGLAVGQSNGLKPGMVKRENEQVQSPVGNLPIKSVLTTRLESWDDATGKARFVRRSEMDPESLKQATLALVRQFSTAASDKVTPEVLALMKDITFAIDNVTTIDVQDGMTVAIDDRSTTSAKLMGHSVSKVEKKTVKVTRLK